MEFRETLKRLWLFQRRRSKFDCYGMHPEVDNFIVTNASSVEFIRDVSVPKVCDLVDHLPETLRYVVNMDVRNENNVFLCYLLQRCPDISLISDHLCFFPAVSGGTSGVHIDNSLHNLFRTGVRLTNLNLSRELTLTELGLTCIAQACQYTLLKFKAEYCLSLSGRGVSILLSRCKKMVLSECAFRGCGGITKLEIPNHVSVLPDGVFAYCKRLEQVTGCLCLRQIGNASFWGCENLSYFSNLDNI